MTERILETQQNQRLVHHDQYVEETKQISLHVKTEDTQSLDFKKFLCVCKTVSGTISRLIQGRYDDMKQFPGIISV